MKRFLTLFPLTQNIHLIKDVGMIPYILHREFGYESTVACYNNGTYDYLKSEAKGLKLLFIPKIFNNHLLDGFLFLLLNFRKYDILQVYHLADQSLIWTKMFKFFSRKGSKTFLKMDADYTLFSYKLTGVKGQIRKFLLKDLDLITVENNLYQKTLNGNNILGRPVAYCPNGFFDYHQREQVHFDAKENVMLMVGRIGTTQKATDVLCEGFNLFAQTNEHWRLEIIGPIEPGFQSYLDNFLQNHASLRSRISFIGGLTDRELLWSYYKKAKIFVLTSRWEGFPLVFTEAMKAGCFIISSDIPAARDVVDGDKYGLLFPIDDVTALSRAMQQAVNNQYVLKNACNEVQQYAYDNFYWPRLCGQIIHYLS